MEGVSSEIVDRLHIESPDWLNDMQMDYRPYEGEEIHEVIKRHYDFLEDIQANHSDDDTILIVGHGCSLYVFVKSLLTKDQELGMFENVSVIIVNKKDSTYTVEKVLKPEI